jgi:DNA-binding NtrC family response regulator
LVAERCRVDRFKVNGTVLIVDDNDIVRKLVCAYVKGGGYRVIEADSPADALEKAAACVRIDAVMVDLVMPDGGGIPLVPALKRIHPSLRTLYMSAHADAGLSGCFIAKPFSSAKLLKALRLLLDSGPRATPVADES